MTDRNDDIHCRSCRFWEPTSTGDDGWCRKKPPVPFAGKRNADAVWPMTSAVDWCGAFAIHPDRRIRKQRGAP